MGKRTVMPQDVRAAFSEHPLLKHQKAAATSTLEGYWNACFFSFAVPAIAELNARLDESTTANEPYHEYERGGVVTFRSVAEEERLFSFFLRFRS